ncbi:MAG: hypothetical protein KBA46_04200 [Candidatus Omnitrophica bacterium]|nr:hypothetical protein [Candidatus Omnitrophota bacterium]
MKKNTLFTLLFVLSWLQCGLAAYDYYGTDPRQFARAYAQEKRAKQAITQTDAQEFAEEYIWEISVAYRPGVATYEEDDSGITSDYTAFYNDVQFAAKRYFEKNFEIFGSVAIGGALTDTETWYVGGPQYQTNDLNFFRTDLKIMAGKWFNTGSYLAEKTTWNMPAYLQNLILEPYGGYGFRYISFRRSNFNILNLITSTDVVDERYYLSHLDIGVELKTKLTDRWSLRAASAYGWVFSNEAHNDSLGDIDGEGGHIVDSLLDLSYTINDRLKLTLGGFVELQKLRGGESDIAIWPDNTLNIFGGNLKVQYAF